jgi:signal transduction histidine kinase
MFSKTDSSDIRSAAWRISLWATLAFAIGTMLVFAELHGFVAHDIQRRSDAWLSGEIETIGDVAEHTPKDRLYSRVMGEVAELASREVPDKDRSQSINDSVFFLQAGSHGVQLWVGAGNGEAAWDAIRSVRSSTDVPYDVRIAGYPVPFRVASLPINDGSHIYLGLSEKDERHVLRGLRARFLVLWLLIVLLGFIIVFYTTRRMLNDVRRITEAATGIGRSDLSLRVPTSGRNDEIGQLGQTLNQMLDQIESTMHQLHTMTDSLAHDLRSPLSAVRAQLEVALSREDGTGDPEPLVAAIDELDRLSEFLNTSLDVVEARADALRLTPTQVDLDELLQTMISLYEPSMSERGLRMQLRSAGRVTVAADAALLHRVIANLLDNEIKHLPASSTITVSLRREGNDAVLLIEDDGPGFDPVLIDHILEQGVKGVDSTGHGLGLAFVEAVVRAHGGTVTVGNCATGGARLVIVWPSLPQGPMRHAGQLELAR